LLVIKVGNVLLVVKVALEKDGGRRQCVAFGGGFFTLKMPSVMVNSGRFFSDPKRASRLSYSESHSKHENLFSKRSFWKLYISGNSFRMSRSESERVYELTFGMTYFEKLF